MFDWMKSRGARAILRPHAGAHAFQVANAGEYQLLYKYLRDRYADRVVLTFAEIEDLLGFALPQLARVEPHWWGGAAPAAGRSAQSAAWTLAGRNAAVNMFAQHVVFDRE